MNLTLHSAEQESPSLGPVTHASTALNLLLLGLLLPIFPRQRQTCKKLSLCCPHQDLFSLCYLSLRQCPQPRPQFSSKCPCFQQALQCAVGGQSTTCAIPGALTLLSNSFMKD